MSERTTTLIVGLGEVGRPLLTILSRYHHAIGIDIRPPAEQIERAEVMHICYPFEIQDFIGETVRYIARYKPALTIINSTVGVGTTRKIGKISRAAVVHSPVRGKHERMQKEMHYYTKFIGALDATAAHKAARHFKSAEFKVKILSSPEATELGKLAETTYFGVMIAWAQDLERYCDRTGTDYNEVISLYDEIGFFPPVRYFPGIIGRHCVMPNIEILREVDCSLLLKAIQASNEMKIERESRKQAEEANEHHPLAAAPKH